MGINVFQIGELNTNFLTNNSGGFTGTSVASEFPLVFDNINANGSRLVVPYGVYGSVNGTQTLTSGIVFDSYGQPTNGNNANQSQPSRPTGAYFVRTLQFSGTAAAPNQNRNGYVGSFCSGAGWGSGFYGSGQYANDINGTTVDYGELIYSHGQFTSPQAAVFANQWRDATNPPSDGSDLIVNSSSVYSRTQYMPPSYFLFHIDSLGANTLGSGNVKFHFENKPTLRCMGYDDSNHPYGAGGSYTASWTIGGAPGPYSSDPLGGFGGITTPYNNPYEYYQASSTRKLNSRGLSLHIAKVMDNAWDSYGYVYEEDAATLSPSAVTGNSGHPVDLSVNTQTEYTWQRDQAAAITFVYSDGAGNTTFTCNNTFTIGQLVYVQGMTNALWANGRFFTVTAHVGAGPVYGGFIATGYVNAVYGPTTEIIGGTTLPAGYAVANPDMRIRQAATFVINEEYYGFVADTKCTIWSNKSSAIPLLFFDLADKWTSSVHKRVAGVAVVPAFTSTGQLMYQLFFLSEDGYLARYDFTQTNGVLELAGSGSFAFASKAPAPAAAGEAYGAVQARGLQAPITATAVTGTTTLTVTAANNFAVGDTVNITGTAEVAINNTTVTVATLVGAGPNYTGFTATIPTTTNYSNPSDTGTASGWSVWALYGTMSSDPRYTQTGLANNANINLFRYSVGLGTWGSAINSGLTGRHNGRSLSEMIVKRDGRIYIMCEDVATSAGFTVSNSFGVISSPAFTLPNINWQIMCYDPVTATWNTSKINGSTLLQYGTNMGPVAQNFYQPRDFFFYQINCFMHDVAPNALLIQPNWCANALQVLNTTSAPTLTNSNLTVIPTGLGVPGGSGVAGALFNSNAGFPIPNYVDPSTYQPMDIVHNRDFAAGGDRTVFFATQFMSVFGGSAGTNTPIFVAPPSFNWLTATTPNAGTVNTSGVTVTWVSGPQFTNIWAGWPININGTLYTVQTVNSPTGVTLTASAGVQTGVVFNVPLLALGSNTVSGNTINQLYNDAWTFNQVGPQIAAAGDHYQWCFPFMLNDNAYCFARASSGTDGLPSGQGGPSSLYGRAYGQAMAYLATYWKWSGSAWVLADTYQDAQANPYTIPAYGTSVVNTSGTAVTWVSGNVFNSSMQGQQVVINAVTYTVLTYNSTTSLTLTTSAGVQSGVSFSYTGASAYIPLPYGLQCQFGPASGTSYSGGEYSTWNICWGNTKYTRQGRFGWAMFAGQTFVNNETRSIASQNAMSVNFIDTDICSVTTTAPTSVTPNTATVTPAPLGWKTQTTWPKLDGVHAPFDDTPFQMVLTANSFNPNTWAFPSNNSGTNTWTVGGVTYVASSISDQGFQANIVGLPWACFSGNPQYSWLSSNQVSGWVQIDLGTAPATVLSYEWRPVWDTGDGFSAGNITYQLLGSNTGAFAGEQVVVDDRTGGNTISTYYRGMAFNCNGTTGSFRYYRFNIISGANSWCEIGMIRMNTSAMTASFNFSDLVFFAYGSQAGNGYGYRFLRNWQWARGLKIEVDKGSGFVTIMEPGGTVLAGTAPLWRMHNGFGFVFPRQVGVQQIRITVQEGYNYLTQGNTYQPLIAGFGPFYLLDYEPQNPTGMVATNLARLGSNGALQGTVDAASWDQQCLGIATDVASISIDSTSPNLFSAYQVGIDSAIFDFYDFATIPLVNGGNLPSTAGYKMHPFFGFILFPGAGADGSVSTQSGTNASITYQWGRRV
jgi:hypothetical protein